ncbi:MAG: c-type cytochrome domain-containing protein [Verrucomicrobiota bacterium]
MSFSINIKPLQFSLALIASTAAAEPVSFKADIAPILLEKCQSCHGPNKAKGKYRVDTYQYTIEAGGAEIHYRVSTDDEDDVMPPDADPLSPQQIALFQRWMDEGAKFDGNDQNATLASIVPRITHPDPPETYARAIPITALAFTPDSQQLLVSGYREIMTWSVADSKLLARISNLPERIHSIDFHPNGKLIAVAGGNPGKLGEVRVFEFPNGDLLEILHPSEDLCFSAAFNPDGTKLATCGADGEVHIYRAENWSLEHVFSNHSDWINEVTWNSDGSKIATASRDRTAKVFDVVNKTRLTSYTGHEKNVHSVRFHPLADNDMYSSGEQGRVMRWRINDGGTIREQFRLGAPVYQLATVLSSRQLPALSGVEIAQVGFEGDGRKHLPVETRDLTSMAISSDGELVAAGARDGTIRIWNPESNEVIAEFLAKP